MSERVYQHVVTKGGESYTRELGVFDDFNVNLYIAEITNIPPYNIIQVDKEAYVNFGCVLKLHFTRQEIH